MAVYVDDAIWHFAGRKWCHLMADDTDELHRFAARLGLKLLSYQGPPKTSAPHYDITGIERDRALRIGAIACGREEIVQVFRRVKVADGKVTRPRPLRSEDGRPITQTTRSKRCRAECRQGMRPALRANFFSDEAAVAPI